MTDSSTGYLLIAIGKDRFHQKYLASISLRAPDKLMLSYTAVHVRINRQIHGNL